MAHHDDDITSHVAQFGMPVEAHLPRCVIRAYECLANAGKIRIKRVVI